MNLRSWCTRGRAKPLALVVGVTPGFISRVLNGHTKPTFEMAGKISAATGGQVTVEELLGGLPEGAVWSPRVAELAQQVDELEMLFSADDLALLRGAKRPMASASSMAAATRGAA